MQVHAAILLSSVVLGLAVVEPAAQEGSDESVLNITAEERGQAISAIAKEFDARYVFPDVGAKVKAALESEKDRYADIATGQELARVLTTHLQEMTKDKHVRVNCSTKKLPAPNPSAGPSADAMKKMQENSRIINAGFTKVERLAGNIGYLRLDGFMNPAVGREPLQAAMTFLQNTDALILDLRYNGGGTPLMIRDLCSYFFSGDKPVLLNTMYFRNGDRTEEFWTHKEVPGPRYIDKPVFVLTSAFTFSGGEECAYNFQTQKRGVIVGETTGGGAHPGGNIPIADHYMVFIPNGRAINPVTKTNWEGVGVKPDVAMDADKALDTARDLAIKALLDSKDEKVRARVKADVDGDARRMRSIEQRRQATLKERQATKQ
jgi:retinol-binding protein 3